MLEQTSRRISVEWDESALPTSKIERILSSFPPEDPEDPRNFSRRTKVSAAVLCSLMTYLVTFATSEYTGAYGALVREFEASSEVVILGLSLMLIGFSVGPLLLSPLSEIFGRKPIMFISSVCFCLWQLGPALAQNIETILVSRFFMGLMGSAPLSVSAGVIADLYDPASRGPMMAMFALAPLMGPVTGPIVGGAIAVSGISWRWTFWIIFIPSGLVAFCMFFVPETYAPVLLSKRAKYVFHFFIFFYDKTKEGYVVMMMMFALLLLLVLVLVRGSSSSSNFTNVLLDPSHCDSFSFAPLGQPNNSYSFASDTTFVHFAASRNSQLTGGVFYLNYAMSNVIITFLQGPEDGSFNNWIIVKAFAVNAKRGWNSFEYPAFFPNMLYPPSQGFVYALGIYTGTTFDDGVSGLFAQGFPFKRPLVSREGVFNLTMSSRCGGLFCTPLGLAEDNMVPALAPTVCSVAPPCSASTSCANCTQAQACVWCLDSPGGACKSSSLPCKKEISSSYYCPDPPCHIMGDCMTCASLSACYWCRSPQACFYKNYTFCSSKITNPRECS